jgi:hypothetical protein
MNQLQPLKPRFSNDRASPAYKDAIAPIEVEGRVVGWELERSDCAVERVLRNPRPIKRKGISATL